MLKKIIIIFGTRPASIKLMPVIKALQKDDRFDVKIMVTAQHRQMLDQMLNLFELMPDYDLDVMVSNQDLFDVSTKVLMGLRSVLVKEKPDMVIVQGDTTTALMGALAAFYLHISCAHVEAGLRTGNLQSPFPEEANRVLVSKLAALHFAPTAISSDNLLKEGIPKNSIYITGNTVIDALFWTKEHCTWQKNWQSQLGSAASIIKENASFILVTSHRRENFGQSFINICQALVQIAKQYPDWHIVYPVHFNPNIRKPVNHHLSSQKNIHLIEPLGYAPFVYVMNQSRFILTDSGGIQEEAPALGKPVLVMRENTERPEAITAGTAILAGVNTQSIVQAVTSLISNDKIYQRMATATNPYGDGKASQRIVEIIADYFS